MLCLYVKQKYIVETLRTRSVWTCVSVRSLKRTRQRSWVLRVFSFSSSLLVFAGISFKSLCSFICCFVSSVGLKLRHFCQVPARLSIGQGPISSGIVGRGVGCRCVLPSLLVNTPETKMGNVSFQNAQDRFLFWIASPFAKFQLSLTWYMYVPNYHQIGQITSIVFACLQFNITSIWNFLVEFGETMNK